MAVEQLAGLTTKTLGRHLVHLASVDSTNDYAKQHAPELSDGAVILADEQFSGKGRMGRTWYSPPGHGLYLSVYLAQIPGDWLTRLPLVTALAVREALEGLCGISCEIKWSNDLLYGGKKLCGILCESRIAPGKISGVIGIGINLHHDTTDLARLGVVYASSLFLATNKLFLPQEAASAICNALEPMLLRLGQEGFEPLRQEYKAHCATIGRMVTFTHEGKDQTAKAIDIAEDGALLVEFEGTTRAVSAEVVHRDRYHKGETP